MSQFGEKLDPRLVSACARRIGSSTLRIATGCRGVRKPSAGNVRMLLRRRQPFYCIRLTPGRHPPPTRAARKISLICLIGPTATTSIHHRTADNRILLTGRENRPRVFRSTSRIWMSFGSPLPSLFPLSSLAVLAKVCLARLRGQDSRISQTASCGCLRFRVCMPRNGRN
jgi:hypothetical protein